MTILSKLSKSLRLVLRSHTLRANATQQSLKKNLRCPIQQEIKLSPRLCIVPRNISKLALIIPRESVKCENPSATRADERTPLLGIILESIIVAARITLILFVASGVLTFYLMTRIIYTKTFPGALLRAIEFLGPTFIKLGQWAATRRDLFSEEFCNTLSRLQRHTPAHSWRYTKYLMEVTYGPNWRNLFINFDGSGPIGSGCCAQVYKAWIERKNARKRVPVAVKILHPGIENLLKRDLAILRVLSECVTYIVPSLRWLSLPDCMKQFSRMMENQIDMNLEAQNLLIFAKNFSRNFNVSFPSPFVDLTNEKILVESFHDCKSISEYLNCEDRELQRNLAKIGIEAIFQMIFRDNFVHCDLHPGNILVQEEISRFPKFLDLLKKIFPSFGTKARLVFLDCGLVASLDERGKKNLRNVFRSVVKGDGELAGEYIMNHSDHMTSDPAGFKRAIGRIVENYLRSRLSLDKIKVSSVVAEFFAAIVRYQVRQDGTFSSIILSMGVIEGLGRSLDPDIDIVSEVLPFVIRE